MPSHEGNEVSFEFESINTTIERDVTQTPLPPEPNVELELHHQVCPMGRFPPFCCCWFSTCSDLQRLNPLIRNGLVTFLLVDCFIFPAATEKKMQSIRLAAKTRALTCAEKWKLAKKGKKMNIRKNEFRKEKRKELRRLKVKKKITEKTKVTKEKDSQHDETS